MKHPKGYWKNRDNMMKEAAAQLLIWEIVTGERSATSFDQVKSNGLVWQWGALWKHLRDWQVLEI